METKKTESTVGSGASNTWCADCTFTLSLECRMCKMIVSEKKESKQFAMCKCDNKVLLVRMKPQEYLTGGNDADAVLVHMKRTGCLSSSDQNNKSNKNNTSKEACHVRNETVTMTLFQWQDMRHQFRTETYLEED